MLDSTPPEPRAQQHRKSTQTFLFTHPRSASNLFTRILNLDNQPALLSDAKKEYVFIASTSVRFGQLDSRYINTWTAAERKLVGDTFQQCFDSLEVIVNDAKVQKKDVFVREHGIWLIEPVAEMMFAFKRDQSELEPIVIDASKSGYNNSRSVGNETVFPDEYLLSWNPTFLIRHPALVFPSLYRTGLDLQGAEATKMDPRHEVEMTWSWMRRLYDWYCKQYERSSEGLGQWPVVVDADDVIGNPEVVKKYCEMTGLDPESMSYEWKAASKEELSKVHVFEQRMKSTLSASTGVVKGKSSVGIDIDMEAKNWRTEFGEEEGIKMERWVRAAMPGYEFLSERKLR